MTATRDQLVGTWRLVSCETRYQDGSVIHPMGDDAVGFLVYAADGYMAATLSRSNRPAFTTGEMMTADVQEKARGWDSYFSYVGRYEIGDGQITHHIEVSQYPNWIGGAQLRFMILDSDHLELSTPSQTSRRGRQASYLTWRRA